MGGELSRSAPVLSASALAELATVAVGGPDPAWHFRITVDGRCTLGPEPVAAPESDAPLALTSFRRDDAGVEIEIFGALLRREIDPADWLDGSPLVEGVAVSARGREPTPSGARGEIVGPAGGQVVWLHAAKWGARLFAVRVRAPVDVSQAEAASLVHALRSLEPVDPGAGRFAEKVRAHSHSLPLDWRTLLPESWRVEPGAAIEEVASFQAANVLVHGEEEETVGKLAFAVFARDQADAPREVATRYLDALGEAGLRVRDEALVEEDAAEPFERSWLLASPVARPGALPGEVRCRVLRHPRAWVLAAVLSPRAEDDRAAWMQNKRALDVVSLATKIKG